MQAGLIASAIAVGSGEADAQEPLKVAAVFETPIEEPWVNQIHVALLRAKDEFGIEYTWSESVSASDFARVLSGYAEQGHGLIMGDSFGTERITRRVARDYPTSPSRWLGHRAGGAQLRRVRQLDPRACLPRGHDRGQADQLERRRRGRGDADPRGQPPVQCLLRRAPRRSAGQVQVPFIGSFFDPPKAKEAAIAQIEAGVDVIYAERFGVIEAAAERGIPAIGNMSDQSELAPDTVVTSVVWDMWPTVKQVISLVQADVFTAQDFGQFSFMGKGGSYLAPYHAWEDKLPEMSRPWSPLRRSWTGPSGCRSTRARRNPNSSVRADRRPTLRGALGGQCLAPRRLLSPRCP